jgi:hypothetical protein
MKTVRTQIAAIEALPWSRLVSAVALQIAHLGGRCASPSLCDMCSASVLSFHVPAPARSPLFAQTASPPSRFLSRERPSPWYLSPHYGPITRAKRLSEPCPESGRGVHRDAISHSLRARLSLLRQFLPPPPYHVSPRSAARCERAPEYACIIARIEEASPLDKGRCGRPGAASSRFLEEFRECTRCEGLYLFSNLVSNNSSSDPVSSNSASNSESNGLANIFTGLAVCITFGIANSVSNSASNSESNSVSNVWLLLNTVHDVRPKQRVHGDLHRRFQQRTIPFRAEHSHLGHTLWGNPLHRSLPRRRKKLALCHAQAGVHDAQRNRLLERLKQRARGVHEVLPGRIHISRAKCLCPLGRLLPGLHRWVRWCD